MRIGIIGAAGRIGRALAQMASGRGHPVYTVDLDDGPERMKRVYDADATVNLTQHAFYALGARRAYFDASEKGTTASLCHDMQAAFPERLFVPNCGIAPGAVNIVAAHMLGEMPDATKVSIYCGALPANRRKGYSVTWSREGLAYLYTALVEERGSRGCNITRAAMSDLGQGDINGETFECFATAGGLGTLLASYPDVERMTYRTLRYPGHWRSVEHLKRETHQLLDPTLAEALEARWPDDGEPDRVVAKVMVEKLGDYRHWWVEVKPKDGLTAIQRATAAGILAAIEATEGMTGYVKQEQIPYSRWAQVWKELTA